MGEFPKTIFSSEKLSLTLNPGCHASHVPLCICVLDFSQTVQPLLPHRCSLLNKRKPGCHGYRSYSHLVSHMTLLIYIYLYIYVTCIYIYTPLFFCLGVSLYWCFQKQWGQTDLNPQTAFSERRFAFLLYLRVCVCMRVYALMIFEAVSTSTFCQRPRFDCLTSPFVFCSPLTFLCQTRIISTMWHL